jgi:3,4-dihydroxy 2-butanone 4-phosphate synthase
MGTATCRTKSVATAVERALARLRSGGGILLSDDADRENEVDMIFSAAAATESDMARLIRDGSGIVCLCLPGWKADELALPAMVDANTSRYGTAFTVSIEAREGVTTGVSASDRLRTVRAAIALDAVPADLSRPGHVFPLRARDGGVGERAGHTEGSVDLMRAAGLPPFALLCELTNPDGTMAKGEVVRAYARASGMPQVSIAELVEHLAMHPVERSPGA